MHQTAKSTAPIAVTDLGTVRGASTAQPGVTVFRGIPYAASTADENRWRPPQPATPWSGVRDAARFGPICPQNAGPGTLPMSEDCLAVNVWTAGVDDERRPVLVWIYGGRFISGHGSDPTFDGAALASTGVVVVTLNYRSGVFGFLATGELLEESIAGGGAAAGTVGNYGLLDQIAALQWVQRNIATFGGDPGRVTVAGQSAGAACVMDLVYSPLSQDLLHGAIAESGALHPGDPSLDFVAASYRRRDDALSQGEEWMHKHGVNTLAELRELPVEQLLVGNDADEPGPGGHRPPLFRPVLDEVVFRRTYDDSLAGAHHRDIPVITGGNLDEDGASPLPTTTLAQYLEHAHTVYGEMREEFLSLFPAQSDEEARTRWNESARAHSRSSTYLWAEAWSRAGGTAPRTYYWTHAPTGHDADTRGAFHGSEIYYVFNSLAANPERPWTHNDRTIAGVVSSYVSNFLKTGDPNGGHLPVWRRFDGEPLTMEIGDAFSPRAVASATELDFFRRFFAARPKR
ncbi:carboxylesterase family protein [Streptomyces sp. NBC_01478]|uniref:carboxylesterase/lipase family protein n=1 Tax=Streptomyces TaxID=1883 RepID=UPI002E3178BC|nr:carboxylesterase family protein [Streptomyces sp. NBC_01478]